MAVDPNVYALSIQLSLDTTSAFASLDEFGTKATNLEESVSEAAKNSIDSITGMVDSLNSQLQQSITILSEFNAVSENISAVLSTSFKTSVENAANDDENLENLQEKLRAFEEIDKLQEETQKVLENEQKIGTEYLGLLQQWVSTLEGKNDVHREEGRLVKAEGNMVQGIEKSYRGIREQNLTIHRIYRAIRATTAQIWSYVKKYAEETEKFTTANYRLYGSQQEILNSARFVAARYGILRDKAIEAYAALGNVKAPRDEIDKLAKSIAGASRYTGVGIDQLAQYAFRMRQIRFDASMMEKQLRFIAEAMRKFGLSTSDVNKILSSTGLSASSLETIFRGEDQSAKYDRLRMSIAGLGKTMGYSAEVSEQFFKNIEDPIKRAMFESYAGQTINSVEDMQIAIAKAGKRIKSELDDMSEAIENGTMTSQEAQIQMEVLAEAYGFGSVEAMQMAASLEEVAQEMGLNLENAQDFEKAMQKLIDNGIDPLSESNNTLTAQLNILYSSWQAISGVVLQLIADAILPLIKALNFVISGVVEIISWVGSLIQFLEKWIPGFSLLVSTLKYVAGAILGIGLAATIAVASLTSFAFTFGMASRAVSGAIDIMNAVIRSVLSLATNIASAITTILSGIGNGFAALGAAIAPVTVPLMKLGLTVMMVGAGFFFMGLGLYYAADSGWNAVGMLSALSVVMLLVVAALAALSTVVAPVIPAMLALAGVMVIFGAAAALVGTSMYLVGLSVKNFADYGAIAAGIMPELAAGVLLLAAAGLSASIGITALGLALTLLIVPLRLMVSSVDGLNKLIDTLKSVSGLSGELKGAFSDLTAVTSQLFETFVKAMFGFALVSVALAPAVPFMIALSLAVLTLGAAVVVAGYGFQMIGQAVESFATNGANAAAIIPDLAYGIALLGAVGFTSMLGLAALGLSLRLLAAPIEAIASGLRTFIDTIEYVKNLSGIIDGLRSTIMKLSEITPVLIVAISDFVLSFAGLAMLVTPAIPSMLALSAVLLILGGAVYLVGNGMRLLGESMESFAVNGSKVASILPNLAHGIGLLASIGILGSIGLVALGISLRFLISPMQSLGESAAKLSEALKTISSENLLSIASGLYEASGYFLLAGSNMVAAGESIVIGMASISNALEASSNNMAALGEFLTAGVAAVSGAVVKLELMVSSLSSVAMSYNEVSGLLYVGSVNMLSSASMLYESGQLLIAAVISINGSVDPLIDASLSLRSAVQVLSDVAEDLLPAAFGIFLGMSWLEMAFSRFKRSADDIEKIGSGMKDLASAFKTISDAPIDSIDDAVKAGIDSMPGLNKLAAEIGSSADAFSKAADKFVGPVDRISNSLNRLGAALAQVGAQGLNFQADMDRIGAMLDKYSQLFEGAAQRIEIAVATKAIPAMADAKAAGVDDTVRSEPISDVVVTTETEGGADLVDDNTLLLQEQTELLRGISEGLLKLLGGEGNDIQQVIELLQTHLPAMTSTDTGLSTEFNQWMK
jgi:hypothetical protein